MNGYVSDGWDEKMRDGMIRELQQNLARGQKVIVDENVDLKMRERWT